MAAVDGSCSVPAVADSFPSELGRLHRYGRKNIALAPRVLRVVPLEVRPELVAEAIACLDERWRGAGFVPDELLPLVAVA